MTIYDSHTHKLKVNAIVNIAPSDTIVPGFTYSVGLHPWNIDSITDTDIQKLTEKAQNEQVLAIGEGGIDRNISVPIDIQEDILKIHSKISEQSAKPLIIHCVRSWNDIIRLKKELRPTCKWIIHGFRGKPEIARQLINHGIILSFGNHFNKASLATAYPNNFLLETDDSGIEISEVAKIASAAIDIEINQLIRASNSNYKQIFHI